jgi:hypothetical protein
MGGIRHARLEAGTIDEAEARLMIVTCSERRVYSR